MNRSCHARSMPGRPVISIVALCGALLASTPASAQVCNIRYSFGTAQLPASDFAAGRYGADMRLLYGDWSWSTPFGLTVDVARTGRYVADIAGLARDCFGDLRYGRLDFSRHQVSDPQTQTSRPETDSEYFTRALDDLVTVRSELASIEDNYVSLVLTHAPVSITEIDPLKSIINDTTLRMQTLAANRTTGIGWIVVLMQDLQDALGRFASAQVLTRNLIAEFLLQLPSVRDVVIDMILDNTNAVLDQYGQFFSADRRAAIQQLLDAVVAQGSVDDLNVVAQNLNQIAGSLDDEFNGIWLSGEPLQLIESKLKFIFGDCASTPSPHPLVTSQFFGDLPVAARIVQEGNDAPLCGS